MKRITERGFTLIELLVVIAIIGILASVVLASLNTARDRGADAAIKSTINNTRAEAELFYDGNGNSYAGLCAAELTDAQAAVNDAGGSDSSFACEDGPDGYTVTGQLSDESFYCVDSTGAAASTSNAINPDSDWVEGTDNCAAL
mgnify:FL=1